MLVQVTASGDTWIWNAVAYAASHCSTTWLTDAVAPRSTCTHCGSLNTLDHRVPAFPSTTADAGVPAPSLEDAVAGLPCDNNTPAACAVRPVATRNPATSTATATASRHGSADATRRVHATKG